MSTQLLMGGCCCWGEAPCGGCLINGVIVTLGVPHLVAGCTEHPECTSAEVAWFNDGPHWIPFNGAEGIACRRIISQDFSPASDSCLWRHAYINVNIRTPPGGPVIDLLAAAYSIGEVGSTWSYFHATYPLSSCFTTIGMTSMEDGCLDGYWQHDVLSSSASVVVIGADA